jgi:TRAP-type mannitol/chloroaromatic compound transport system permease small subunit
MSILFNLSQRSSEFIDALIEKIGRLVSWLSLIMVLLVFGMVVLRYLFNVSWVMVQESVIYLHSLIFMLGASYTLKHDGHVRVDIIYQRCSQKEKAWIDLLGTLFLLIPVAIFILWGSWEYVADSWKILESSRNSGGLPLVYLLKSCLILMSGLLVLQGVSLILAKVNDLMGAKHG